MLITTNFTNTGEDVGRYRDGDDLRGFCRAHGLDGLELMPVGDLALRGIPAELVVGVHLSFPGSWYDFWVGDEAALLREYGTLETVRQVFGGDGREALLSGLRRQLDFARRLGARYVVFHASNVTLPEATSYRFEHDDEAVCLAAADIANRLTDGVDGPEFLVENLWWPGLTMTRPEVTRALMEALRMPGKGIMLDTGHLAHMNLDLRTQAGAVDWILRQLDAHGELCRWIRGMHLHQSLTGDVVREMLEKGVPRGNGYSEDYGNYFQYLFGIDRHEPFDVPEARRLVERVAPEYLTHELITRSRLEHEAALDRQRAAIGGDIH